MTGFGGSITDSSAAVLYRLSPAARDAAMRLLFDPGTGDGLSFLRQPIGASDFVADAATTPTTTCRAGQTDYRACGTSASPTTRRRSCRCCARRKRSTRSSDHGHPVEPAGVDEDQRLADRRPADRRPADLPLLRAVPDEVRRRPTGPQGVHVDSITRAERAAEPHARHGYPGTDMPSLQEEKVIEALGPMLRAAGPAHQDPRLRPQLVRAPQRHRVAPRRTRPRTPTTTPRRCSPRRPPAGSSGTAYHCYYGDPSAMTALHDAVPGQGHLLHRVLGQPVGDPGEHVLGHAQVARAQPEIGSPGTGPRRWSTGTSRSTPAAARTSAAAAPAPASSRSAPATRSPPTPSTTRSATSAASSSPARCGSPARRSAPPAGTARSWTWPSCNPDGSTVLVAHNENDNPQSFSVSENGQSFNYTLPGDSLATFVWARPPRGPGDGPRAEPVRLAGDRRARRARPIRAAPATWPPTPWTTTPPPGTPPAQRRLRASTCRSTWAGRSR